MPLEQHIFQSQAGRADRKIWTLSAETTEPHPICIFLDGEFYLERVDCLPVIEKLRRSSDVVPFSCAFVSYISKEVRHEQFLCKADYGAYIVDEVAPWVRQLIPGVQPTRNITAGLSLSGLAAAHIGACHPNVFNRILAQSGSFWWLADNPFEFPANSARCWFSVGDEETETYVTHEPNGLFQRISQIEGVESAVAEFRSRGADVHYSQYHGGHDMQKWREELADALKWLLGN